MSDVKKNVPGSIAWTDLTVKNADEVRDFYSKVVGWRPEAVSMGDYDDYSMIPQGENAPVAGICHSRGMNADLPSQWLVYIIVEDVDRCAAECEKLGGSIVSAPKNMGPNARMCVIQDPSGAVAALYSELS